MVKYGLSAQVRRLEVRPCFCHCRDAGHLGMDAHGHMPPIARSRACRPVVHLDGVPLNLASVIFSRFMPLLIILLLKTLIRQTLFVFTHRPTKFVSSTRHPKLF